MTPALPPIAAPSLRADDLDTLAKRFSLLSSEIAEARIAAHAAAAIAARRIDEAVLWQRVKFRSRLLRAIGKR